ncbi:hypothetical protein RI367_005983 [Sorochytrium milnesiophthora]
MSIVKSFGKFKQWTNEKLGHAGKTETAEDFKQFQKETETRRDATEQLAAVVRKYTKTIDAKKVTTGSNAATAVVASSVGDKQALLLTMGVCMASLAEITPGDPETGEESKYGRCLALCGEAEQKLGHLQHDYVARVKLGYAADIDSLMNEYTEYTNLKKKLEGRRLDFDAKLNRVQKSKKEKPEWEEEMRGAQHKYEETLQDIQQKMEMLAGNEEEHASALVSFVEAQMGYFQQSLAVLQQLQATLVNQCGIQVNAATSDVSELATSRASIISSVSATSLSGGSGRQPPKRPPSRANSTSQMSTYSQDGRNPAIPAIPRDVSGDRLSIMSSNSAQPAGVPVMIMPSPAAMQQQARSRPAPLSPHRTGSSNSYNSAGAIAPPPVPRRSRSPDPVASPPLDTRKRVLAQYDFTAEGPDELSMAKGDVILVIEEIDEGWWIGELNGQRGMFPANYTTPTTVVSPTASLSRMPATPAAPIDAAAASYASPIPPLSAFSSRQPSPERVPASITSSAGSITSAPVSRSVSSQALPKSASVGSYLNRGPLPTSPRVGGSQNASSAAVNAALAAAPAPAPADSVGPCATCGCEEFVENVFKRGQCNNCFHKH